MADRRWSAGEDVALIEAWRQLYNRRRGGESDVWVPANQRTRARSTRALVVEDWRAVATAVNSFRAEIHLASNRTHKHCQRRVERLRRLFGIEKLAAPSWYDFLVRNNSAGRRRDSGLRVLATAAAVDAQDGDGDECGAPGGSAVGGSAAAVVKDRVVTGVTVDGVDVEMEVEDEEGGIATEALGSGATSEDPLSGREERCTAAAMGFFGGPIPKKRRTGASTSGSGVAAEEERARSVKEELAREENARRARVDAGRAPAGGAAAMTPEVAAVLADLCAAQSHDVAALAKLSEMFREAATMYKETVAKRLEVQRQIVVAATAGGAAVPEPDAAPRMPAMGV